RFYFFFQAEDGIRDFHVTGVQTCALPISLDQGKLRQDMVNSARFLKSHELSNGKLGAVGFCWGGGMVNHLAVALGDDLDAGVPFYCPAAAPEGVAEIKAPLRSQYASNAERI